MQISALTSVDNLIKDTNFDPDIQYGVQIDEVNIILFSFYAPKSYSEGVTVCNRLSVCLTHINPSHPLRVRF